MLLGVFGQILALGFGRSDSSRGESTQRRPRKFECKKLASLLEQSRLLNDEERTLGQGQPQIPSPKDPEIPGSCQ